MNAPMYLPIWQLAAVYVVGVAWSLVTVAWLGPDGNWDLYNYHYYNGFMFAENRLGWDIAPAQRQTFFNPLLDVPTFLIIEKWGIGTFTLILAAVQGLLAPVVWLLTNLVCGMRAGAARALTCGALTALAVVSPVNVLELGTSYGDNTTGVLVLVSLLVLLYSSRMRGGGAAAWALTAGLVCGAAFGLKLTNAVYAVGLVAAAMALPVFSKTTLERRAGLTRASLVAIGVLGGFVLTYGSWGLQLWELTGNPFFPQFNNVFESPYAAGVHFVDDSFKVPGLLAMLAFPWSQTSIWGEVNYQGLFDLRIALVLSAFIIAGISIGVRRLTKRDNTVLDETAKAGIAVMTFFALSYVSWLIVFTINRYAGVLELLAPIVFVVALRIAFRHSGAEVFATGIFAAVVPASMAAAPELWLRPGDRLEWTSTFGHMALPTGEHLDAKGVLVVFGGDAPSAHVAPALPPGIRLIRVTGNLYWPHPAYSAFAEGDLSKGAKAFENALMRQACQMIRDPQIAIAGLTGEAVITPVDRQTLKWLGLEVSADCEVVASGYGGSSIRVCPLRRLELGCFGAGALPEQAAGG